MKHKSLKLTSLFLSFLCFLCTVSCSKAELKIDEDIYADVKEKGVLNPGKVIPPDPYSCEKSGHVLRTTSYKHGHAQICASCKEVFSEIEPHDNKRITSRVDGFFIVNNTPYALHVDMCSECSQLINTFKPYSQAEMEVSDEKN